jgi:hypothetical protein
MVRRRNVTAPASRAFAEGRIDAETASRVYGAKA